MSNRQASVLASRVICVFLVFWVVSNIIDLPGDIMALHQHVSVLASGPTTNYERYLSRYYSFRVEALVLKSALELFFAGIFYRCGPRVSRFLGESSTFDSTEVSPTT